MCNYHPLHNEVFQTDDKALYVFIYDDSAHIQNNVRFCQHSGFVAPNKVTKRSHGLLHLWMWISKDCLSRAMPTVKVWAVGCLTDRVLRVNEAPWLVVTCWRSLRSEAAGLQSESGRDGRLSRTPWHSPKRNVEEKFVKKNK